MARAPDVLVLGGADWHGRRLAQALQARGASVACASLADCAFAIGSVPSGIELPGMLGLPAVAVVRFIAAGSFEQVTRRLGVLHALREQGVRVVNDARAIERCVDKSATSFHLARAGLPTPPCWACESAGRAQAVVAREAEAGFELVHKPLFGAQGRGLRRIAAPADLPPPDEVAGVYYLQRYIGAEAAWHDFRVLVVGRQAVAAMRRAGSRWVTNLHQGAVPEPWPATGALAELAVAAALAVGADYAGVDLMRDREGRLQVLEVNSMPAWKGLQSVCGIDVAGRLADFLRGEVPAAGTTLAVGAR